VDGTVATGRDQCPGPVPYRIPARAQGRVGRVRVQHFDVTAARAQPLDDGRQDGPEAAATGRGVQQYRDRGTVAGGCGHVGSAQVTSS
jgi:hypothetical protein